MFYKIHYNYSNIKILARKLTRKPYGLMIVSSLLKYTLLNNLTYELNNLTYVKYMNCKVLHQILPQLSLESQKDLRT